MKPLLILTLLSITLSTLASEPNFNFSKSYETESIPLHCRTVRTRYCPGPGEWNCREGFKVNCRVENRFFFHENDANDLAKELTRDLFY